MHTHTFLVFHGSVALLTGHVASLAHQTGTILLLLLLSSLAEDVAALAFVVGVLLIAYGLIDSMPGIVLAARWHQHVLILVVDLLVLVLKESLSGSVR